MPSRSLVGLLVSRAAIQVDVLPSFHPCFARFHALQLELRGILELRPGDAVFARDMWGSGRAEDDILQHIVRSE